MKNAKKKCFAILPLLMLAGISTYASSPITPLGKNSTLKYQEQRKSFYPDETSFEDCLKESRKVISSISDESMVLLKNKENVLPLQTERNVSLFGVRSESLFITGGGSGSGPNADPYETGLKTALEEEGFHVNPILSDFYKKELSTGNYGNSASATSKAGIALEVGQEEYTEAVKASYSSYQDAAIIVISRGGSEGGDNFQGKEYTENGKTVHEDHYLELTKEEKDLIASVKENGFEKIIIALNTGSTFECSDLEKDDSIDSILWLGLPGSVGIRSFARILKGEVNPSGKTADLFETDFTMDPTYQNFADNSQTHSSAAYLSGGKEILHYVSYEEGIYQGYRYYETRGKEEGEDWYSQNVTYPFGYGLSYTQFAWSDPVLVKNGIVGKDKVEDDATLELTLSVENTGNVPGKDVVELYLNAPYTKGGIEKASDVLVAFAKTKELQPGEKEKVTLKVNAEDMASFDSETKKTSYQGYVLEKGDYKLALKTDSHKEAELSSGSQVTFNLEKDVPVGEHKALFSQNDKYNSTLNGMEVMSRSDFSKSFPTSPKQEENDLKESDPIYQYSQKAFEAQGTEDEKEEAWYEYYHTLYETNKTTWNQNEPVSIDFSEMKDASYDDPKWDKFLNQMSWEEMLKMINGQSYYTYGISRIGIPEGSHGDGPCCIYNWHNRKQGSTWPSPTNIATTWNVELAKEYGKRVGNEGMWLDVNGWYAPATDGHRSPFGGRNFEYYSEDGYLAGMMSGKVIQGAQSKGLMTFLKHFAVNEQEYSRQNLVTWIDEQTLREVATRSFRIAIREGNPLALMSSMNRIGIVGTDNNYPFLTELLRDDFGFKGFVTSDMIMSMTTTGVVDNIDLFARAGMDVALTLTKDTKIGQDPMLASGTWNESTRSVDINGKRNDIQYAAVRNCTKHILYSVSKSNVLHNGVSLDSFHGNALQDAEVGNPYTASLALNSEEVHTKNVLYRLSSGNLPKGLTLNTETGEVSGTPVKAGKYTFKIEAAADYVVKKEETFTLNVTNGVFALDNEEAQVGKEFKGTITTTLPAVSSQYSYLSGELPCGVRVNADGTITGTPLVSGDYSFTVKATVVTNDFSGAPWLMIDTPHDYEIEIALHIQEEEKKPEEKPTTPSEPTKDSSTTPTSSEEKKEEKTGCGGSVAVVSSLVASALVVSLGLALKKKKED